MPADGIKGQRGAGVIGVDDLAVGHQSQLDQGLETVADAAHQAIPLFQQLHDLLLNGRIPEESGDELGGAIGLIAAGEAAGNEDHLAVPNPLCHIFYASGHIIGGQVADHRNIRFRSRGHHRPGGIVLAVGAGEYGNQHPGLCHLHSGSRIRSCRIGERRNLFPALLGLGGIDLLQDPGIPGIQLFNGCAFPTIGNGFFPGGIADSAAEIAVLRQLGKDGAVAGALMPGRILFGGKADGIAEGHLHHRFRYAAGIHSPGGRNLPGLAQSVEPLPGVLQRFIAAVLNPEIVDGVTGLLKLIGDDFLCLQRRNGKGDHRRRHILVEEGAGHGVLAADGSGAQMQLGIQCTQQGLKGLAPALGLVSQLFKELL